MSAVSRSASRWPRGVNAALHVVIVSLAKHTGMPSGARSTGRCV